MTQTSASGDSKPYIFSSTNCNSNLILAHLGCLASPKLFQTNPRLPTINSKPPDNEEEMVNVFTQALAHKAPTDVCDLPLP